MKQNWKNKLLTILSLVLCASTVTACSSVDQTVVFTPYWNANINAAETELSQVFEYKVTLEKSSDSENKYLLDYSNGKYVTKIETEKQKDGSYLYKYSTNFTVDVTYTLNSGELTSYTSTDTVETTATFQLAQNRLRPHYSYKKIVGTTPLYDTKYEKIEDCYAKIDSTAETTYAEDGKSGETKTRNLLTNGTYKDATKKFSIKSKYTYLDNEQWLFAIRGINPQENATAKVNAFAPFSNAMQSVSISFSAAKGEDFTFTKNGESVKSTIQYYPVTVGLNMGTNSGNKQTIWLASYKDNPAYRNMMLRMEVPLHYSLGTIVYALESATF